MTYLGMQNKQFIYRMVDDCLHTALNSIELSTKYICITYLIYKLVYKFKVSYNIHGSRQQEI